MEGGASNNNNPSHANPILENKGNLTRFFQLEQELRAEMNSYQADIDLNTVPILTDEFSNLEPIPGGQIRYIPYSNIGPFHAEAESSNGPRCRCGKRRRLDENEAGTSSATQEFCECEVELTSTSHHVPSFTLPQVRSSSTGTQAVVPNVQNAPQGLISAMAIQQPAPSPPSAMLMVQGFLIAASSTGGVDWSFTPEQLLDLIHARPPTPVNLTRPPGQVVIDDDDEIDAHHAMRRDVDRMSYEELLALGDQIGYVNTGLAEDTIEQRIQRHTLENTPEQNESCCICLEEYASAELLGKLDCSHEFHFDCIKQWLQLKNSCPVCKKPAAER